MCVRTVDLSSFKRITLPRLLKGQLVLSLGDARVYEHDHVHCMAECSFVLTFAKERGDRPAMATSHY
jgi:hypothetical protein